MDTLFNLDELIMLKNVLSDAIDKKFNDSGTKGPSVYSKSLVDITPDNIREFVNYMTCFDKLYALVMMYSPKSESASTKPVINNESDDNSVTVPDAIKETVKVRT